MEVIRYDRASFKATRTDEGYLIDTPVVGRAGIQLYKNADGSVRRELRPPDEVFHADSLSTFGGKPITFEHPSEKVTAKNVKRLSVGTIKGDAYKDNFDLRAPIIIHDEETIEKIEKGGVRELSLGYTVDLEETPGVWEGQEYDAIQRRPRINHLAIVPRGRAGNARLNLDRHDAEMFTNEDKEVKTMELSRVKLDTGLEYQAQAEVIVEIQKMRDEKSALSLKLDSITKSLDTVTAERDTIKAQVVSAEKVRADALESARAEIKARFALDKVAESFKIDGAGKTDRELKEMVIKSIRADADLIQKSDEYINAAFDMTVAMRPDAAMMEQRKAMGTRDDGVKESDDPYKNYMKALAERGVK